MEPEGRNPDGSVPKTSRPATVARSTPSSSRYVTRVFRSRSSQGMVGDLPKNASSRWRLRPSTVAGEDGLFVEHVLAAPLLEEPGELRGREVPLGGPEPCIVPPPGGAMHVQSARNLHQKNTLVAPAIARKQCLADDWPDRPRSRRSTGHRRRPRPKRPWMRSRPALGDTSTPRPRVPSGTTSSPPS